MLVDARGIPRYWATIWASVDGTILAPSTLQRQLSAIEKLYAAIENRSGRDCLDDLLTRIDLDGLEPLLEGYFVELRNRSSDEGLNGTESWQVAIKFIRDTLNRISCVGTAPAIDRISARLQRLDALYARIKPVRVKTTKTLRALPAGVLEDLQEIMEPGSDRNPFKSVDNAVRNYALFHLLLHQGLRRGEAAILP